jgi:uncharacterized membrane protein YphA (DoxX/SURF4 family)
MLLRRVARPLLAGIFIQGGIAALRDPKTHADLAAPVLDRAAPVLDKVTEAAPIEQRPPNETLVKVDAVIKIGAGTLLALGKFPRLSAAALAPSLIATTAAGHRFWEESDPNQRLNQQVHFAKNLGLLGGLMLAAADTEGKPSLAWRAKHAGQTGQAAAELFHKDITEGLGALSERAGERAGEFADAASRAGDRFAPVAARAQERAVEVAGRAQERAVEAADRVGPLATRAADRVGPLASRASDRVAATTEHWLAEADARSAKARKQARKAGKKARKRAEKRLDEATKRASKEIDVASKRASKRLDKLSQQAAKESSARLNLAQAKAREVGARAEKKLA